jgi:3D (Asp-Asp-Asp) domain-containing protein
MVAFDPDYYGWTAVIYLVAEGGGLGDLVGYFSVEDTGSAEKGIRTGKTVDVYQESYAACKEWMLLTRTGKGRTGSEVYIQLVKADG